MRENKAPKKEDLRIRMTRKMIVDAMADLLEDNKFEEIHVSDICERATIHRTTFYKHFEDKYHLLRFMIEEIRDLLEKELVLSQVYETPRQYSQALMKKYLSFLGTDKRICTLISENDGSNTISAVLHQVLVHEVQTRLQAYVESNKTFHSIPVPIIAEYHIGALVSLSIWWIQNSKPYSEDELSLYIDQLVRSDVY